MSAKGRAKVLVVTPWFPSASAPGAGIFVWRDVLGLSKHFDVTVVHVAAPQFLGNLREEPVWPEFRLVRSPFSISDYRSLMKTAAEVRRQLRAADLLHTMTLGALTPLALLRVRVPWVHTEHWSGMLGDPQGTWRSRRVQTFLRRQLKRPDSVVAVSRLLADAVSKWGARDLRVIPNAVESDHELPAEGAWDYSQLRMVAVGSLVEAKGVFDALDALIALRRNGHDATLTLVGEGPAESELEARAVAANVREYVFLRGQLSPSDVHHELRQANIGLMPTKFETFGVAIAEAAVAGLPVVTGDYGGFTDFLDKKSSRMVSVTEARQAGALLAEAVVDLTQDGALPDRREIAASAAARFNEHERLQRYETLYVEVGLREST